MNLQVLTDPFGRLLWASPALPGAVHDVRAAREHGIVNALAAADIKCWADKAYRGVGGTVRTPYWGRWETLSPGQQAVNRSHAKIRALVEQAMATLKRTGANRALLGPGIELRSTRFDIEAAATRLGQESPCPDVTGWADWFLHAFVFARRRLRS